MYYNYKKGMLMRFRLINFKSFCVLFVLFISLSGCASYKPSTPIEVASGFTFPEGPSFAPDGSLFLVNFRDTMINRVSPEGKVSIFADNGFYNNGAIFDRNGNLYIASSGGKSVYKYDKSAKVQKIFYTSGGDSLRGPNDFAWSKNGDLYFSDPFGSGKDHLIGGVHRIRPDGTVVPFAGGLGYPNGMAFSLDGKTLYVDETGMDRITKFGVNPDGSAGKREVLIEFPENSGPDGMKIDVKGNLWVAIHYKAEILGISPEGKIIQTIKMPTKYVTNFVFGGKDMKTAYVTCFDGWDKPIGKILKIRMPNAGVPTAQK